MSDDAEWVEVHWGSEKFSPVQFHVVEVGPFSLRTRVRPGEEPAAAMVRAYRELEKFAAKALQRKFDSYLKSVEELGAKTTAAREAARARAGG